MSEELLEKVEDRQILEEVITNEKLVSHPKLGQVRLKMPTLEVQRKIDAIARNKKKYLKDTKDKIPDPEAPDGYRIVPAFKSRDLLEREYAELGWWTPEDTAKLQDLSKKQIGLLTELELLGFESEEKIYDRIKEIRGRLFEVFAEAIKENEAIGASIINITVPGDSLKIDDQKFIREEAPSTEVDDLLGELNVYHRQYNTYVELAKTYTELSSIQTEHSTLFSDSWQEQLQYYIRLAQVFYCTESATTGKPLWASVDALEQAKDLDTVKWAFAELTAFWQGLSDDVRQRMDKYSFTSRRNTVKESSESSPVPSESLQDGELSENKQESSSNPTDTEDQSPTPK